MPAFDLDDFLAACQEAVRSGDGPLAVRDLLDRVSEQHATIPDALGTPATGALTCLHHEPDLTVFNVVWTPGMKIGPHDHTMTAGIVVYGGREENGHWRRRDDGHVEPAGGTVLEPGDVAILGRDAVHSVRAHATRFTGALHVYGGDFFDRVRSTWDDEGSPFEDPRTVGQLFDEAEAAWQASSTNA